MVGLPANQMHGNACTGNGCTCIYVKVYVNVKVRTSVMYVKNCPGKRRCVSTCYIDSTSSDSLWSKVPCQTRRLQSLNVGDARATGPLPSCSHGFRPSVVCLEMYGVRLWFLYASAHQAMKNTDTLGRSW